MQLDRHIIDFFQWLHDLLWLRQKKHANKVVEKIGSPVRTPYGYIQQIRRHLPPQVPDRDVSAWIFMPLRGEASREEIKDYYIVCLFLGTVACAIPTASKSTPKAPGRRRRATDPTHRIIVVRASRWLNTWEGFESNLVFYGDYDLQGRSEFPHRIAENVTRELVMTLRHRAVETINWGAEIEILRKIQSLSGP